MSAAADPLSGQVTRLRRDVDSWFVETGPASVEVSALGLIDLRKDAKRDRLQVAQFLVDFGYHRLTPSQRWDKLPPAALQKALTQFFAEAQSLDALFEYDLAPDEEVHAERSAVPSETESLNDPLHLKPSTIHKIKILGALDGNLRMRAFPGQDEVSLRTRLLHHRLILYGLLDDQYDPASPWDPDLFARFLDLKSFLAPTLSLGLLKWVNLVGDLQKMARRVAKIYIKSAIVMKRAKNGAWFYGEQRQDNRELAIRQPFGELPEVTGRTPAKALDRRKYERERWNRFGVRFLQLALWYDGYYLGEIDGEWGPTAQKALITAGETEGLIYEYKKKRHSGVRRGPASTFGKRTRKKFIHERSSSKTRTDYLIIDLSPFITDILELDKKEPEADAMPAEEMVDQLGDSLQLAYPAPEPPADQPWRKGEAGWTHVLAEMETSEHQEFAGMTASPDRRRRVYQGRGALRRALLRIRKWFRMAAERIGEFVRDLFKMVGGPIQRLFGFLKTKISRAIRTARAAVKRLVHYVTGRPYVTRDPGKNGALAVTRFAWDLDTVNLANANVDPAFLERHLSIIKDQNKAFAATVEFALKVARFAINLVTGPLGWARAAWSIYQLFQSAFSRTTMAGTSGVVRSLAVPA